MKALIRCEVQAGTICQRPRLTHKMLLFYAPFAGDAQPVRQKIPGVEKRRLVGGELAGKGMVREKVHDLPIVYPGAWWALFLIRPLKVGVYGHFVP